MKIAFSDSFSDDVVTEVISLFKGDRIKLTRFVRILQQQIQRELKVPFKFSEYEFNKILCPTTFITNWQMYHPFLVLVVLEGDFSVSIAGQTIDLDRNKFYSFSEVSDPSFVLSPHDKGRLYYILYRAPRFLDDLK